MNQNELKEILNYDLATGIFTWKKSLAKQIKVGDVAGSLKDGYIRIVIKGKKYYAHRLAWLYVHGYLPENQIDHKDQISYHNWINNLREVSNQCNSRNCDSPKNNTSGIKGISWNKKDKKWSAYIAVRYKKYSLGSYDDFDDAVCARLAGEQCLGWNGCDSNSPAYNYVKEILIC